jgi:RNA polymerase sigma factor (TIGR02999 family)
LILLARAGDAQAGESAFGLVYEELRTLARIRLARRPHDSLQSCELVHDMYQRLVAKDQMGWESRRHFFALAARAMHDILVERARAATARKRGGRIKKVSLESAVEASSKNPEEFLMLADALSRLYEQDVLSADVVRMRYFVGLSGDETAEALEVSPSTVDRRWQYAKAWLYKELYG